MSRLYIIAILVAIIGILYNYTNVYSKQLPPVTENIKDVYDYIIVGAGSAGSVLAARLSEPVIGDARGPREARGPGDGRVSVLVLEAGPEEIYTPEMEVPVAAPHLLHSRHFWNDRSRPNPNHCQAMEGKKCYLPRGRGLGGGSSVNAMQYVRGNAEDYDRWEELGADGWSYKDVLPYFIKSEKACSPSLMTSDYHGTSGPLFVTAGGVSPIGRYFVYAGEELGYNITDHNGENQEGFSFGQQTVSPDGTRASTVKAFLRPAMSRDNLDVTVNAHVTKILIEDQKAVGVEFVKDGVTRRVMADREVVLSAGAIGTPHILLLSGVGPKEQLQKHGIPVVADLPVGENLQDHVLLDGVSATLNQGAALTFDQLNSPYEIAKYLISGRGKLTSGSGLDGMAFVRMPSQPAGRKAPFMQLHLYAALYGENEGLRTITKNAFYWTDEFFQDQYGMNETLGKDGFHILPTLLHPYSRGSVGMASRDPFSPPIIDAGFYNDKRDVRIMLEGIRFARKVADTEILKQLNARIVDRPLSMCTQHEYNTDQYWECYLRHNSLTVYHPSGTCRMGRVQDNTTVVDSQLRVKGISRLRVADASVMPEITSGNTNAPCIMIGEKAADLIRGEI